MKKIPYTPLQIAMHIYAWSGLIFLIFDFVTGNLSPNPIQDLEQRTGRHAITLLVLLLLCTPINTIFKWSEPLKRRRALGLYTFMYATIHVIIFADLDYGLRWSSLIQELFQKPRLIVGVIAFMLLIPLAITSFDIWKKRLGKNWKRLHQLYCSAGCAALCVEQKRRHLFTARRSDQAADVWTHHCDFSDLSDSPDSKSARFFLKPNAGSAPRKESAAQSGCALRSASHQTGGLFLLVKKIHPI